MRFLQSILQDARRPLSSGFKRIQRSPSGTGAGESPAPPLEEAEDGAMTLYRFQKEGATNPQQVAETHPAPGTPEAGSPDLPLSPSWPRPLQAGQTLAFKDFQLDASGFKQFAVSGNDRVLTTQSDSMPFSADVSESAVSTHASSTHTDLSQKWSETNQIPDLHDPSAEHETADEYRREIDKSRRRETGAATPSENPHTVAARTEQTPARATPPATGPAQPAQGMPADPTSNDGTTHRPPPTQSEALRIPDPEERNRQPDAFQSTDSWPKPGAEHPPTGQAAPRVSIGQLEVMVVKTPRTERPAKAAPSRHFLSRNYLRRL